MYGLVPLVALAVVCSVALVTGVWAAVAADRAVHRFPRQMIVMLGQRLFATKASKCLRGAMAAGSESLAQTHRFFVVVFQRQPRRRSIAGVDWDL